MNELIKKKINERRSVFVIGPKQEMGQRFNSDQKVMAHIRMDMFEKLKLKRLPTEEQALKLCGDQIDENIDFALAYLSKVDFRKSGG